MTSIVLEFLCTILLDIVLNGMSYRRIVSAVSEDTHQGLHRTARDFQFGKGREGGRERETERESDSAIIPEGVSDLIKLLKDCNLII